MPREDFVRPETIKLQLVEVHRRALKALQDQKKPKPATKEALMIARGAVAEAEAADHFIEVKKRLTAGEQSDMFAKMYVAGTDGTFKVNPFGRGYAIIEAYLVDWSLARPIRGVSEDELTAIIRSLDGERLGEVRQAIEDHMAAMDDARTEEKKQLAGANASSATSPSPDGVIGDTTGSLH